MLTSLQVSTPTDREIVLERRFNAPRRMVWDALTKPDLIRKWLFAPPGWEMTSCEEDLRVGGAFRWEWACNGQPAMSMHGVYKEVSPPTPDGRGGRLVRTETFDTGCAPRTGEQICTLSLTENAGRTHLKLTILFPSKDARDALLASGMTQGVSAGYDNLDQFLASSSR